MSMQTKFAGLALTMLFMAGCAGVPPRNCVAFGRGGQVCLLPPAQLPPMDGVHMVTVDQSGKRQVFIGQLHIDAQMIRLAGSSLFGPSLFSVSYDGHNLRSEPANGPQRADILIAMLELVAADQQVLEPTLHGLTLTNATNAGGKQVRELFEQDHLVAHIEIGTGPLTQATVRFDIPTAHLSILMQPLASQP